MLVFGPIIALPKWKPFTVYNFTSTAEYIPRLDLLPPREIVTMNEYEFDLAFSRFVLEDNNHFNALMQIIYSLYNGDDVFVAISNLSEPYLNNLNESLMKLIQQRYGYNANRVNFAEDILYIDSCDGEFSFDGLMIFDQDRERYVYNMEMTKAAEDRGYGRNTMG